MASAMSALFGSGAKIKVKFADAETRPHTTVTVGDKEQQQYLFGPGEPVCGTVRAVAPTQPLRHLF